MRTRETFTFAPKWCKPPQNTWGLLGTAKMFCYHKHMKCNYKQCHREAYASGACKSHTNHLYRYGEMRHLACDPNEIEVCGDTARIVMYTKDRKRQGYQVLIDTEDVPKVCNERFYVSHGYAKIATSKKTVYLHQIIAKCAAPLVTDHINQNKLDNRKKNLRCVTRHENMLNMDTPLREHRWGKGLDAERGVTVHSPILV